MKSHRIGFEKHLQVVLECQPLSLVLAEPIHDLVDLAFQVFDRAI